MTKMATIALASAVATTSVGLVQVLNVPSAHASVGASAQTLPVSARLSPIMLDGSTSGQLSGKIDLPVPLGDIGVYELPGLNAPVGDLTGNGRVQTSYPAGSIDGVLTDPEDGTVDDEPGRGIEIGESSDQIVRTPSGFKTHTLLQDVVIDVEGLNDKAALTLGVAQVVTVGKIETDGLAHVNGTTETNTTISDLTVLGESIALTDGKLAQPVSRTLNRVVTDVVSLARALGMDEEDIAEYSSLISSARLELNLTITVDTPAAGGFSVRADISGSAKASLILGLGGADLRTGSDTKILDAQFARVALNSPAAIAPQVDSAEPRQVEPGQEVTVHGQGFVDEATSVTVAGTNASVRSISSDGTELVFEVNEGFSGGTYPIAIQTPGGIVSAGNIEVDADDSIPLSITGVSPTSAAGGEQITLRGAGFIAGDTSVKVTDAQGNEFSLPAARVQVADSQVSAVFVLPESAAAGPAQVTVTVPDQEPQSITLTVLAYQLPNVAVSGEAFARGISSSQNQVPLTLDNSSAMTWSAPELINPAGQQGSSQILDVSQGTVDNTGNGSNSRSEQGLTGSVVRTPQALTARVESNNFALTLPSPWDQFFSPAGAVVRADRLVSQVTADTQGGAADNVELTNLTVLGNTVSLDNGRLTQEQTFQVTYDSSNLKSRQAMNGVFFSDAKEAYDRIKSESFATFWVTVKPVAASLSNGLGQSGAFEVVADLQYRYYGENGGLIKTRARHGSGNSRDGQRVTFYTATIGQVKATSPTPLLPAISSVSPNLVNSADLVTLHGRGFTASSEIYIGSLKVTAQNVAEDGTSLSFLVPQGLTGQHTVSVRTAGGTSNTRTLSVRGLPVILAQPSADVAGLAGQQVAISVSFDGVPDPRVQWQRLADSEWIDIPGATSARLRLTLADSDHDAQIRAVVANELGSVISEPTTITVNSPPVIRQEPTNPDVLAGENASLRIVADGRPAPSIQWQRQDSDGRWQDIEAATSAEYSFVATREDNNAIFRANVSNEYGSVISQIATINVRYAPVVTEQPVSMIATSGAVISVSAASQANPVAAISWQYQAAGSEQWQILTSADTESASSPTVHVTVNEQWDGALIRAVFDNGLSEAQYTQPATVIVMPQVTVTGEAHVGKGLVATGLDSEAAIEWAERHGVEFSYQWLRDGEPISDATNSSYELTQADQGHRVSIQITASAPGFVGATLTTTPSPDVLGVLQVQEAPEVTGSLKVGGTVSVSAGQWNAPISSTTYQWFADGEQIDGAIEPDLTIPVALYGKQLSVRVIASSSGYVDGVLVTQQTAPVAEGTLEADGLPTITGAAVVGQTLTASGGQWPVADVAVQYQWLRDGDVIAGADESSYQLTAEDQEHTITVRVTGNAHGYEPAVIESQPFGPVAVGTFRNLELPTISGELTVGHLVSASPGSWEFDDVEVTYQWFRNGIAVEEATSANYELTGGDYGATIGVQVKATRAGYAPVIVSVATDTSVAAGLITQQLAPSIQGKAKVGEELVVKPGSWNVAEPIVNYQWLRDGRVIESETGSSYAVNASDVGALISVRVTVQQRGYATQVTEVSSASVTELGEFDQVAAPTISGVAKLGEVLVADAGAWTPKDVSVSVAWSLRGQDEFVGFGAHYMPLASHVGLYPEMTVTIRKEGYRDHTVTVVGQEPIAAGELEMLQSPALVGEAVVGQRVGVTAGRWRPANVEISYRWLRDGKAITGANQAQYVLQADDQRAKVTVQLAVSAVGYIDEVLALERLEEVRAGELVLTAKPQLSGAARVASTLSVAGGNWKTGDSAANVRKSYQWFIAGQRVPGASKSTFTVPVNATGKRISVRLSVNADGYAKTGLTLSTSTVSQDQLSARSVVLQGKPKVGKRISARISWSQSSVKTTYRWVVGGKTVAEGAKSTYRVKKKDRGKKVRVVVTGTKTGYKSATVQSKVAKVPTKR